MILYLAILPFAAGFLTLIQRNHTMRRVVLILTAFTHLGLTIASLYTKPPAICNGWFYLDIQGTIFLSITSMLFCAASVYALVYLKREEHRDKRDYEEGFLFRNAPEMVFISCMQFFLGTMTLVIISQHFGILWVAMEATTLVSAPLIYFHRHHRSLEATWKYLLICSVGIALALLGNLFLAVAGSDLDHNSASLLVSDLLKYSSSLHVPWLKAAFIFFLVGYGTKMGLAPLHTWLPDAHSEAPSLISALLSGALLNCAFLGILRIHQVLCAAGESAFSKELLLIFGFLSILFAALFILGQTDFKRMLAYSSVEHMGIIAIGVGIGKKAVFGALLHAINHSALKAMLFFLAGNIISAYKTKNISQVHGITRILPVTGIFWIVGFLALTGTPPFGMFISEFTILKEALDQGRIAVAALFLAVLALIFIGMAVIVLKMAQGKPTKEIEPEKESVSVTSICAGLCTISLVLGVYIPPALQNILNQIVLMLEKS